MWKGSSVTNLPSDGLVSLFKGQPIRDSALVSAAEIWVFSATVPATVGAVGSTHGVALHSQLCSQTHSANVGVATWQINLPQLWHLSLR